MPEAVLAAASGDPPYLAIFWLTVFGLVYYANQRGDRRRRASRELDPVADVDRFRARFEIDAGRATTSSPSGRDRSESLTG